MLIKNFIKDIDLGNQIMLQSINKSGNMETISHSASRDILTKYFAECKITQISVYDNKILLSIA